MKLKTLQNDKLLTMEQCKDKMSRRKKRFPLVVINYEAKICPLLIMRNISLYKENIPLSIYHAVRLRGHGLTLGLMITLLMTQLKFIYT